MRRLLAALAVVLALALPTAALAYDLPQQDQSALDAAASWISQQPATTVSCLNNDEDGSPFSEGAWAYVYLIGEPIVYADVQVCEGALAIVHHDSSVPLWEQALGALVITHEGYHLRVSLDNRDSEAATECRAIRHTAYMMRRLGADEDLVARLMPYALAIHWNLAARFPQYNRESCQVPWYW